jgi:choloylglycine hydrolase
MQKIIPLLVALMQIFSFHSTAIACTSFLVSDANRPLMGKSYDWYLGHGMVVVNQRGMKKTGLAIGSTDQPPTWTSKYGSVTFNQYGLEFPVGGMNEAGLAVEVLWHFSAQYPEPDARPSLNELQWIQYQLDNFASVKEMIAHADEIRVAIVYAKVHYMAVDRQNHSASFSYIDGKLVIHENTLALTNTTLSKSRSYLKKFTGFNGDHSIPKGKGSRDRYVITRSMLAAADRPETGSNESIDFAFSILDAVKAPDYTQWQIVYDLAGRVIHFRTAKNQVVRRIRLEAFDFSCIEPVIGISIDSEGKGNILDFFKKLIDKSDYFRKPIDVTDKFSQLTDDQNADMIARGANPIRSFIPKGVVREFKGYPASTHCENDLR